MYVAITLSGFVQQDGYYLASVLEFDLTMRYGHLVSK